MKRRSVFAVSLMLVAMLACSGPPSSGTPPTTQPTPTNGACTFAITPSTANFATGGGSQVVNVSVTPSGCAPSAWTASTANTTLSVAPSSGSGNGTVTVTASPNTTTAQQTLTATVAGQAFTATVAPVGCTYTFTANRPDQNGNTWVVSSDASQQGVSVTITPNDGSCAPWKAASSAGWITVSPTSGTMSTTVAVNYSANTTASARTGDVSFTRSNCTTPNCGLTVELNQGPTTPPLAPLQISVICSGPYRPGDIAACFVEATVPAATFADLSAFGGPAEAAIPSCPACGFPPFSYDMAVRIPADMTPGVKTIAFWATDTQRHRVNATGSIEIVSR